MYKESKTRPIGRRINIFRNEENLLNNIDEPSEFYKNTIAPYKGEIEKWFTENNSLKIYFLLIFVTILVVLFLNRKYSGVYFMMFQTQGFVEKIIIDFFRKCRDKSCISLT